MGSARNWPPSRRRLSSQSIHRRFPVLVPKATLSNTDSFTWTNTSTYGRTSESMQQASTTIVGPSSSWDQGAIIDVYYDTIYSAFLFAFDPNSVPAVRERMASLKGTIISTGKPVAHQEVILIVGGQKFRTYTNSQGTYYFYNKPHGSATISVRGVVRPTLLSKITVNWTG
jgi:hypothetical protein